MTMRKMAAVLALLLSATPAMMQSRQTDGARYGDRPYYDNESSGWLDYNDHPGYGYGYGVAQPAHRGQLPRNSG